MKLTQMVETQPARREVQTLTDEEFNDTWPPGSESIARQLYDQLKAAEARGELLEAEARDAKQHCRELRGVFARAALVIRDWRASGKAPDKGLEELDEEITILVDG